MQAEAALTYPLFRKAWMKVPIQATVFGAAFYIASQLQTRFLPKFSRKFYKNHEGGIKPEVYLHNHDLISKFRMFDHSEAQADSKTEVENYLDVYQSGPLTKAEMLNRIAEGRSVDEDFMKKF